MSKEKFIKIKLMHREWKKFLGNIQLIIKPPEKLSTHQYFPLTPVPNADEDQVYNEMLTSALQQKDVKNIALTGPYGSGKSSVLLTFQKSNPNWNYLNISLATFKDNLEKDTNENSNKEVDIEAIEKSILQQLFYSVDQKNLPKSRLKRIVSIKTRELIANTLFIIIWIFLALLTFSPENIIINNFSLLQNLPIISKIIIKILFISYCIVGLFVFLQYIEKIKELKLKFQDTEITLNNNTQESILNKHLDEILYFFEETNFDIIIIEDLDRFNNTEIFIRLRELNTLINAAKQVNRRIVFLYAIKDDMFKNKDRAKFFDFIIPIIPVINPTNAYDLIKKNYINDKVNTNLNNQINEVFLHQISLYFDDLRLVINIFNEFELYVKKLNNNHLNKNKLLAIIIYKNYYPSDFTELHKNRGQIYNIFNKVKLNLINNLKEDLQLELNVLENIIDQSNTEQNDSIIELRKIYLYEIQKKTPIIKNTQCNQYGGSSNYKLFLLADDHRFSYDEILDNFLLENENFEILQKSDTLQWNIEVHANYTKTDIEENNIPFTFNTIENLIDSKKTYKLREESIKNKNLEKRNELINKRKIILDKINTLKQSTLKELLNLSNSSFFDDDKQPKLLQFLIREGYIDENYSDYISFFFNSVITIEERDYAQRVLNQIESDYTQPLINVKKIFDRYLTPRQFSHSSILNFDMVDYVIKNKNLLADHFRNLFILLSNEEDRSKEFIIAYIERGKNLIDFINTIVSYWGDIFKFISENFPNDQIDINLKTILKNITDENIKKLNKNGLLTEYISEKEDFINFVINTYETNDEVLKLLEILSPEFNFLNASHKDLELFNEICEQKYFILNKKMIFQILILNNDQKDYEKIQEQFDSAPYGTIQDSQPHYLIKQIDQSIDFFFEEIIIPHTKTLKENSINFLSLINREDLSLKNKEWLIKNNNIKISSINEIKDSNLWELIIINLKIIPDWESLILYFKHKESIVDDTLITYLNNPEIYSILCDKKIFDSESAKNDDKLATSFESNLLKINKLSISAYKAILKAHKYNYTNLDITNLSSDKVLLLCQNKILSLTEINLQNLRKKPIEILVEFLFQHQSALLKKIPDEFELTSKEFELILASDKIKNSIKKEIIDKFNDELFSTSETTRILIIDFYQSLPLQLPTSYLDIYFEKTLSNDKKLEALISQIKYLETSLITNYLNLLGSPYNGITTPARHRLDLTNLNNKLTTELEKKGYIHRREIKNYKIASDKILFYTK
ncbi:hypothetical protein RMB12_03115 [Acinetobacter sp. V117_2]|uniref:YobI family P-loop NTPase n=1 Tax=Acinetobacter sp. V117_2 TaxID=3072989 RepID=UPI00287DF0A7|nr:hypothetical protein [Acinetobacter sp. V117_2]MDS7966021.1 hypothetical protein [Acinetobacter sp. V117_2]